MDEKKLQLLWDKQEIHDVLIRYCRGIDRRDEELLRSVYHDDAVDLHGAFNGPASEFVTYFLEGSAGARFLGNTHSLSNILIEVQGDIAYSESYVTSWHPIKRDGADFNWLLAGRYVDRFERRDDVWKIARRQLVLDWDILLSAADGDMVDRSLYTRGQRSREDPVYAR